MSLLGMKELNSIQHMPSEAGLGIMQRREGNLVVEKCVCVRVCICSLAILVTLLSWLQSP